MYQKARNNPTCFEFLQIYLLVIITPLHHNVDPKVEVKEQALTC